VPSTTPRALETTLTQKGQVTIPAAIRTRLGLKPRDRVRFEIDGDDVRLKPAQSRLARHFGAVPAAGRPRGWRKDREAFETGVAREASSQDQ